MTVALGRAEIWTRDESASVQCMIDTTTPQAYLIMTGMNLAIATPPPLVTLRLRTDATSSMCEAVGLVSQSDYGNLS